MLTPLRRQHLWMTLFVLLSITLSAAATAYAQGRSAVDARAEVASALYAASATQAAAERVADLQLRTQAAEIERLRREGRANRVQIAELEERYVADLAERDRAYAQEIAVFRAAVVDIAATAEGAAALARFNAGDEVGALAILDQLRVARDRARQARANIESAAERRRIATLALEARNRGRLETQAVVQRFEEVTSLDGVDPRDWITLANLYTSSGNTSLARDAAARALALSTDLSERVMALNELSSVFYLQGDLPNARASLEEGARLLLEALRVNPSDSSLLPDIYAITTNLGDILVQQGDLATARERFQLGVAIANFLREVDPTDWTYEVYLAIAQSKLAQTLMSLGDAASARDNSERSVAVLEHAAGIAPESVEIQSRLAEEYFLLGDILRAQGDARHGMDRYQQSITVIRRLIDADPDNSELKRSRALALERIGDALSASDDLSAAIEVYEEHRRIIQDLVNRDPANTVLLRDLALNDERQGNVMMRQHDAHGALTAFRRREHIIHTLAQADPSSAALLRDEWVSKIKIASAYQALEIWPEARVNLEAALEISAELRRLNGNSTSIRLDAAMTEGLLADALLALGDRDSAEGLYESSFETINDLVAADPSSATLQAALSVAFNKRGEIARANGLSSQAMDNYRQSAAILDALIAQEPTNVGYQWDLLEQHFRMAQLEGGARGLRRVVDRYRQLGGYQARPNDLPWVREIETLYRSRH